MRVKIKEQKIICRINFLKIIHFSIHLKSKVPLKVKIFCYIFTKLYLKHVMEICL